MPTISLRRGLPAAGVAVALLAALLVALTSSSPVAHSEPQPAVGHTAFSALRSGPTTTLSPRLVGALTSLAAGSPVTAHAGSSSGGVQTSLVQAGTNICLVTSSTTSPDVGGVGCSHDVVGYAVDDLHASVMFVDGGYAVSGATPDGTHDVTVTTADGQQDATIANSTFTTVVKSTPTAVNWIDAAGAAHHHALINPDVKP